MKQKIKCPTCFHHVPADGFCPRCTRLNISEAALDSLLHEFGIQKSVPNTGESYTLEGRWSNRAYLLLAVILGVIGTKLAGDFLQMLPGVVSTTLFEEFPWKLIFTGAGSFCLLYLAAALGFNKTRVIIDKDYLDVRRGPVRVPLSDSYRLSAREIKRLDLFRAMSESDSSEVCEIMAVDNNGESFDVFQFDNLAEALSWYKTIETIYDLKEIGQSSAIQRRVRTVHPKAETISAIYRLILPGSFALNIPAIFIIQEWHFNKGYWLTFGLFTLLVFLIMNFHHRKHLNVMDSHPLEADEEQVGPIFYGVVTVIYCLLLTPFAMLIYNFYLLGGGLLSEAIMQLF